MMGVEQQPELIGVQGSAPYWLDLRWGDGREARVDLSNTMGDEAYEALREPAVFTAVDLGDWGHSLVWPGGVEIGADSLWLDSLSSWGRVTRGRSWNGGFATAFPRLRRPRPWASREPA